MPDKLLVIDEHVHVAGPGDVHPHDLYWSPLFEKGIGFQGLKVLKGWSFREVGDELMEKTLVGMAEKADNVDRVVALAFDNVYDVDGRCWGHEAVAPDQVRSTLYVSNRFVAELARAHPKVLPGISVHPFRDDALEELERYRDEAVLCKLMPSAHWISFEDPVGREKLDRYYRKLADIGLPLLLHTGVETSIPSSDPGKRYDRFNNPKYAVRALDLGVTVILAHCGCSYFDLLEDNFVREALELFARLGGDRPQWHLFADISALFSPFRRRGIVDEVFAKVPVSRLLYGSDFPNPAKGRNECLLRVLLRFGKRNLIRRYRRITDKWLAEYFPEDDADRILTNFPRLLTDLGRPVKG